MGKRQWFSVKNFERYQHYKDRNPPWIKLYYGLLDDYDFLSMSEISQYVYIKLLLLASRTDNKISADPAYLMKALRANNEPDLSELFNSGFLIEIKRNGRVDTKNENWPSRYIPKQTRDEVFIKFGFRCAECGDDEKSRLEIDHIIPISHGGKSENDNLQVLCRSCNRRKRNKNIATHMHSNGRTDAQHMPSPETETETETETENNKVYKKHISKPEEVSEQTWKDFLKIRDAKKTPFTQTALNRMMPQVQKSGKTLEEVLQICCQRGWQGFEADWVKEEDYYA